jgi:general secretion pathway protein D
MTSLTRTISASWLRLSAAGILVLTAWLIRDRAQAQTYGQTQAVVPWAFTIRSPYRSLPRTEQLVDAMAARLLLVRGYADLTGQPGNWRTTTLDMADITRQYGKSAQGLAYRTLELAVLRHPENGHELHFYGVQAGPDGTVAPNAELPEIRAAVQAQVDAILAEKQAVGIQDLAYQVYHLSYIQSDKALAILKSLGYTTVEFAEQAGESIYERIYSPVQNGQWKLPVVVKLIDSSKTSLMEPSPTANYPQQQAYSAVPDIGGTFLHQTTSGDPQQRLLVVYDRDRPEPMESLLGLIRDTLDRPARQIVIEALVIEINTDRLKDLGVSLNTAKGDINVSFEDDGSGGNPFSFVFDKDRYGDALFFRGALKAMMSSGEAEILSSPSVLVLDGRQARIQVGQQVPVVKSTLVQQNQVFSVDYFPVGIVLNLRPRISEDGAEISMQVETIVSAVSSTTGASTDFFVAPTIDNRQVQSFVRVADNTPFIIGGLISTEKRESVVGIPILSRIPILGIPFRRKKVENNKKEVIVVLTPHVVPLEEKSFSYVIPKDSDIFDAFGYQLFRNAYRVRDDDVFDLRFLYESQIFQGLLAGLEERSIRDPGIRTRPPYAAILNGEIPGEDIIVRRMLWEIVKKTDYTRHISADRMILMEDRPASPDSSGFRIGFLHNLLANRDAEGTNTLTLTFDTRAGGTQKHPFVPPKSQVSYEQLDLSQDGYLASLMHRNQRAADGRPDHWSILLTETKPPGVRGATTLEVLQGVMVLKRLLALNTSLPLTIGEFRVGRQIIFPTDQDLKQRYHIIDRDAAQYFYEVIQYYPEFEKAFSIETRKITRMLEEAGY